MPTLQELRSRLPQIRDLGDEDALTFIQRAYYPGRTIEELGSALGVKPPAPPVPKRGFAGALNDTAIEFSNAVAGGAGSAAEFVAPGNSFSKGVREFQEMGESRQSDAVKAEKARFSQEVEAADGISGELAAVGGYVLRNPLMSAAQAAGSFVGPGVAIKGAQGVAKVAGAGVKAVERAGLAGGAAAGAALSGGDAAGQAYELAKQAGASDEEAAAAARDASVLPAVVGGVGGLVGAERVFAGAGGFTGRAAVRAAKTGLVEGGQEAFEEGVTNYEGRRAAQPFDPSIDPMKGTAAAAGMGFALGGATGAAVGAMSPRSPAAGPSSEQLAQEAEQRLASATNVSDMISAANDLASVPLDMPAPAAPQAADPQPQPASSAPFDRFSFGSREAADEYLQRLGADWAPAQKQDGTWSFVMAEPAAADAQINTTSQRIQDLRQQLADPAARERVRAELGPDGLETLLYYAQAATRKDVPAQTAERMLGLAEMIMSRSVLRPIPEQGAVGSSEFGFDALAAPPAVPRIPLDTAPTGVMRVDAAGSAAPETRADVISTRQAQAEQEAAAADAATMGQPGRRASAVWADPKVRTPAPPINMPARRNTDAVLLEPVEPADPVAAYVERVGATNTPAARAFAQDFRAGRITRQDVIRVMQSQSQDPLSEADVTSRLQQAAAQAPAPDTVIQPAKVYRSRSAAFVQARKVGGDVVPVEGGFAVQEVKDARPDVAGSGGRGAADLGAGNGTGVLAQRTRGAGTSGAAVSGADASMASRDDGLRGRSNSLTVVNDAQATRTQGTEAPAAARQDAAATPAAVPDTRGTGDVQAAGLTKTPIDAAAHDAATSPTNATPEPTQAQKEAGNYKVGRVRVAGLDISIENPQGSVRKGVDEDGKAWSNTLQHHYGYIRRTEGADGDHVDVFVKPGTADDYDGPVYVVDQVEPSTGRFDEHKALIGFDSEQEARDAYQANYAKGWAGLKSIREMSASEFKEWVQDPANTQRPADQKPPTNKAAERPENLIALRKRESVLNSLRKCLG